LRIGNVFDFHPLLDDFLSQLRLPIDAVGIEHAVGAADLDVLALHRDLFMSLGFLDFDAGGGTVRGEVSGWRLRWRGGAQTDRLRCAFFDQSLQRIELGLTTSTAHLPLRNAKNLAGHAESGFAIRTLGQHWGNS